MSVAFSAGSELTVKMERELKLDRLSDYALSALACSTMLCLVGTSLSEPDARFGNEMPVARAG